MSDFCLTEIFIFGNICEQAKDLPFTISLRRYGYHFKSLVYDKDIR